MSGIQDLNSYVIQWARKAGKGMGISGANKAKVTVIWNRVKFIPGEPKWTMNTDVPSPPNATIFSSTFFNNSESETEHTLKMERKTNAVCKTTITKGYTSSVNASITLALPNEVASATVGFGREVRVDTADETTIEQEEVWSVDTKVTVMPRSRTRVKVDVEETRHVGGFTLPVTLKGMLVVNFYDQNSPDNYLGTVEGDVVEILGNIFPRSTSGGLVMTLEGKSDFVFGVEQNVDVSEE